jgi:hypothetical protein
MSLSSEFVAETTEFIQNSLAEIQRLRAENDKLKSASKSVEVKTSRLNPDLLLKVSNRIERAGFSSKSGAEIARHVEENPDLLLEFCDQFLTPFTESPESSGMLINKSASRTTPRDSFYDSDQFVDDLENVTVVPE